MELSDILSNAVSGFMAGFAMGITGSTTMAHDRVEYVRANFTPEQMENEGVKEDMLDQALKREKVVSPLLPYFAGSFSASLSGFFCESSLLQNTIVAIPSAYIGTAAGRAVRKIRRRSYRDELEIAKKIKADPQKALDYIEKDTREAIEGSLGDLEEAVLRGEQIKVKANDLSPSINALFMHTASCEKAYSNALSLWAADQVIRIHETANIQRSIRIFHEVPAPACSAIIGPSEKTALVVYEFNGTDLNLYQGKFDDFEIIKSWGAPVYARSLGLKLTLSESREWDGDYKRIAKSAIEYQQNKTTVFLKTPRGIKEHERVRMVRQTYASNALSIEKDKGGYQGLGRESLN